MPHPLNRRTLLWLSAVVALTLGFVLIVWLLPATANRPRSDVVTPPEPVTSTTLATLDPTPVEWWSGCELLGDNRLAGRCMMLRLGWAEEQWPCLDALWTRESGWNHNAHNRWSGAGGIPQAYPASKMATAGPGWRWDAITQIDWGLRYIRGRYSTPCQADRFQLRRGWY